MTQNSDDDKLIAELNQLIHDLQTSHDSEKKEDSFDLSAPVKVQPKSGVFLWWPGPVEEWAHPEDHEIAAEVIPSDRIFRREELQNGYFKISYGDMQLRIKPIIWLEVSSEGYAIGDEIEVKSNLGRNRPFVASIVEIRWDQKNRRTLYRIEKHGQPLVRDYLSHEFQMVKGLDSFLDQRKLRMLAKSRFG